MFTRRGGATESCQIDCRDSTTLDSLANIQFPSAVRFSLSRTFEHAIREQTLSFLSPLITALSRPSRAENSKSRWRRIKGDVVQHRATGSSCVPDRLFPRSFKGTTRQKCWTIAKRSKRTARKLVTSARANRFSLRIDTLLCTSYFRSEFAFFSDTDQHNAERECDRAWAINWPPAHTDIAFWATRLQHN